MLSSIGRRRAQEVAGQTGAPRCVWSTQSGRTPARPSQVPGDEWTLTAAVHDAIRKTRWIGGHCCGS